MNAPKQTPEVTSGDEVARKLIDAVERLGRALGSARREVATRHGLSLLGLQLLEALDRRGATAVGELAAELDVRQPTISDAISTLETRGLLTKHRSELDRRTTEVELTAAGATTAGRILEELAPILRPGPDEPAAPLDYRSAPRAQALQVVLEEIHRLQTAGVITVNRSCLSCTHFAPAEPGQSARCLLLAVDLPPAALRVHCAEHEPPA